MSDYFLFVANLNATISRGCASSAISHLYSGTQAPNVGTPARLPTLRVATTAEIKRALLYLLARLRVESDLAYLYPAIVTGVGLTRVILRLGGWVRVGCARLSCVHSVPPFSVGRVPRLSAPAGPLIVVMGAKRPRLVLRSVRAAAARHHFQTLDFLAHGFVEDGVG